jgi:hypothetical protein
MEKMTYVLAVAIGVATGIMLATSQQQQLLGRKENSAFFL